MAEVMFEKQLSGSNIRDASFWNILFKRSIDYQFEIKHNF